jgi:hypothetical protein
MCSWLLCILISKSSYIDYEPQPFVGIDWVPLAYVGINGYKLPTRNQICEWNGFLKDYLWNLTLKELHPLFCFAKIKFKFKMK